MDWNQELDARGLLCPLPVLKARKRLKAMAKGEILRVLSTDPASVIDVPHFCNQSNHRLMSQSESESVYEYLIERG